MKEREKGRKGDREEGGGRGGGKRKRKEEEERNKKASFHLCGLTATSTCRVPLREKQR